MPSDKVSSNDTLRWRGIDLKLAHIVNCCPSETTTNSPSETRDSAVVDREMLAPEMAGKGESI